MIFENRNSRKFETQIIYTGRVVSVDDTQNVARIKVRIPIIDSHIKSDDDDALDALPLLPRHINVFPQVNERVFIFIERLKDSSQKFNHGSRYWVGPIVSQPQDYKFSLDIESRSRDKGGILLPKVDPELFPQSKGAFPKKENIYIHGRDNCDVVFRPKEVIIRAGKFIDNEVVIRKTQNINVAKVPKYNDRNPAFIQIKYSDDDIKKEFTANVTTRVNAGVETSTSSEPEPIVRNENSAKDNGSVINLVADKINIISHDGENSFNLVDRDQNITTEQQIEINTSAHPLVHGDTLVEILDVMWRYIKNHQHQSAVSPNVLSTPPLQEEFNKLRGRFPTMLNKNIKIS
jgi:hypothetical protein